ncbi:zinc finger protein RFP-like [Carettochelys insculpta]|uniref:zinc finger protein RFP-like n=1 Tax=Carettochelys insculpta TaxID=44489 RepID=UPI003EB8B078
MAAGNPVKSLQDEATCSICLQYFTVPVTLECGHNFCRPCISQCWEGPNTATSCPQCRVAVQQRNIRLNRQLANVADLVKQLSLQAPKGEGEDGVCGEHQEALKLFCEEDHASICLVCHLSQAHRAHRVVPIQEAAQEYKEKFQAWMNTLGEEREKLLRHKTVGECRSQEYLKHTQIERQKIMSEFQQLWQFLVEQERLLLAQLEMLDQVILKIQNDNVSKLSAQISHLSELIQEIEGKCQKPASKFLQDIRSTLIRCQMGKFQPPEAISPELEGQVIGFSMKTTALWETLSKFKDTLNKGIRGVNMQTVNVTLDPDTAHPHLVLSEGGKSVRWEYIRQRLPDNLERFDTVPCVLGREGFTSGRHYWEVEVRGGQRWAVGVARGSVSRKGEISLSPKAGIWAVRMCGVQFWALTWPEDTPLPLHQAPSRIRVCLDCDRGQVTFIDAGAEVPIFTYPPGSIPGDIIRPWFWVWTKSQLRLCP